MQEGTINHCIYYSDLNLTGIKRKSLFNRRHESDHTILRHVILWYVEYIEVDRLLEWNYTTTGVFYIRISHVKFDFMMISWCYMSRSLSLYVIVFDRLTVLFIVEENNDRKNPSLSSSFLHHPLSLPFSSFISLFLLLSFSVSSFSLLSHSLDIVSFFLPNVKGLRLNKMFYAKIEQIFLIE